ncbi:MAG: hypothetical protein R3F20_17350 [Planctomycetota bacterium]
MDLAGESLSRGALASRILELDRKLEEATTRRDRLRRLATSASEGAAAIDAQLEAFRGLRRGLEDRERELEISSAVEELAAFERDLAVVDAVGASLAEKRELLDLTRLARDEGRRDRRSLDDILVEEPR